MEAAGSDRAETGGRSQGPRAADGQGDTGGDLRCQARRGGGDDTEEAGGKELAQRRGNLAEGARGGAVAGDVLPGGVDMRQRYDRVRRNAQNL